MPLTAKRTKPTTYKGGVRFSFQSPGVFHISSEAFCPGLHSLFWKGDCCADLDVQLLQPGGVDRWLTMLKMASDSQFNNSAQN